ncbi:MAG TPA: hypothetical protein VHN13_01025, partial [Candidatus Tectomicrobia bacterium]|nr:hypothetical protein [Candidatus Tectomicrobia bacterium]
MQAPAGTGANVAWSGARPGALPPCAGAVLGPGGRRALRDGVRARGLEASRPARGPRGGQTT